MLEKDLRFLDPRSMAKDRFHPITIYQILKRARRTSKEETIRSKRKRPKKRKRKRPWR